MGSETSKKKLQLSFKKTRLIPGKIPSEEIQKQTVQEIGILLKKARKGEIHVVFGDPTHKVHNTVPARCWQKRGKDGTLLIRSNSGRKRVTVLGFYNPITCKFTSFVTESNCDQYTTAMAHKVLRKDYPDNKEIVVIQDNAGYNHAYAKWEERTKLNFTPYFLPAYCPNLNLIERLWKFMKKTLIHNEYYEKFSDFFQAIINFCGNLDEYSEDVQRLMSHKFEILKAV